MTDNTQELDEILSQLMKDAITNRRADDPPQSRKMLLNEAKQAIIDWHNKQIEAKLVHISEYAENVASVDENSEFRMKAIPLSLIAVEINKLKESKDE